MAGMPRHAIVRSRGLLALTAAVALGGLGLAACGQQGADTLDGSSSSAAPASAAVPGGGPGAVHTAVGKPPVATSVYPKVMIIAEENEPSVSIIGASQAPYLTQLAGTYGNATNMVANYPVSCPSLAAYIIVTSGNREGICDDGTPASHPLSNDNIFRQLAVAGKEYRQYSESMTTKCQKVDGTPGGYLVRHAPATYYTSEVNRCPVWAVPLGTTAAGNLHDDLASGLADFSFVTPNACHDMHGATPCATDLVQNGDDWLKLWMPKIIASDDFQNAQLLVIITWDEGSTTSNHIPTLILGKTIQGVTSAAAYNHCSTLRTAEELLKLPLIGCATTAASFRTGFHF
jgi:phosphatidylinositol-3-phosphatase